ncbi:metal-sensitive transcriptional regulator [Candidatus Latescibacterota bacterium]
MNKSTVCHGNKAHHTEKTKQKMSSRLNRIEGQVRGINKMINDDVYCDDILHQILSVEAALTGVKKMLLEAHMKSCIIDRIENGDSAVLDELMTTIGKMIK